MKKTALLVVIAFAALVACKAATPPASAPETAAPAATEAVPAPEAEVAPAEQPSGN